MYLIRVSHFASFCLSLSLSAPVQSWCDANVDCGIEVGCLRMNAGEEKKNRSGPNVWLVTGGRRGTHTHQHLGEAISSQLDNASRAQNDTEKKAHHGHVLLALCPLTFKTSSLNHHAKSFSGSISALNNENRKGRTITSREGTNETKTLRLI